MDEEDDFWDSYDWSRSQFDEGMMVLAKQVASLLGCEDVPYDKMIDLVRLLGEAVGSYGNWSADIEGESQHP